jgi:phosphatidylinositol alpha-1,6-mannosyltransferase
MYLVVTKTFPPEVGGMQNLMWGLANELSKHYMIKVFADYHENHKLFDEQVSFSIERVGGIKLLRKYRKAQLINEFIKENKIDGIIADHWKSLEHLKTNKKKICLIHGKEINHEKGTSLNKRIVVINPGVDPVEELDKKTLDKVENLLKHKSPRLITVSRFDKRKNHFNIIMALRNLKQIYPNIVYICIGHGDEENNIKDITAELSLNDQVMFFRNITSDLKNSLLSKSNIFVMPSIINKSSVEGFGIAYIEAAQYGVPSLGGKDGGASDAIENEKTGLICDGNDLEAIYSSIDLMLKNNRYIEYGKSAKENSSKFLWNKIIEKYKKIL